VAPAAQAGSHGVRGETEFLVGQPIHQWFSKGARMECCYDLPSVSVRYGS
jgi:hypothetical protein